MSNIGVVAIWPDGTWCDKDEIEDYLAFMSDDYALVEVAEWAEDASPAGKYFDALGIGAAR